MAGSITELSKYRYERALEDLKNAKEVFNSGSYKLALNRSYYAIFHAIRAVNVLDEFDSSKHSGVIAHFNQYHVKTGDFEKNASKIIQNAMEMREHADYEDFFVASKKDAEEQISKAEQFLGYVKSLAILYYKTFRIMTCPSCLILYNSSKHWKIICLM